MAIGKCFEWESNRQPLEANPRALTTWLSGYMGGESVRCYKRREGKLRREERARGARQWYCYARVRCLSAWLRRGASCACFYFAVRLPAVTIGGFSFLFEFIRYRLD